MTWFDDFNDPHRPQLHIATLGAVDDGGSQQLFSGSGFANHPIGQAVRRQAFGLTTVPPAGAEGLFLSSGGRSDRGHIIGLEHASYRPTGNPAGTAVLYDQNGNAIRAYTADGIQIEAKSGQIWVKPAQGKNVYLGGKPGDGDTYKPVMLADMTPSSNVYARA